MQAENIGGEISYWFVSSDISAKSDANGLIGTPIDFDDMLNVDDKIGAFEFKGWLRLGKRHQFSIGLIPLKFDGEVKLDQEIIFDGNRFRIGEEIDAEFKINWISTFYQFDLIHNDYGILGLRLGAEFLDVDAEIYSSLIDATANASAISPAVGIYVEFYLTGVVAVEAKLDGFLIDVGDVDVNVFDGKAAIRWDINENCAISGGLHLLKLDVEVDNDSAEATLVGPVISGRLSF